MRATLVLLLFLPAAFCVNPFVRFKKNNAICTEKNTICMTTKYGYGCCPSEDAVCCTDGEHCCPKGFECNVAAGKCLQYGDPAFYVLTEEMMVIAPMAALHSRAFRSVMRRAPKFSTIQLVAAEIVCPDGMSKCPDNETCCKHTSDSYACCPRKDAVCCADMKHCCPEGYQCDPTTNTCIKQTSTITAIPLRDLTSVVCPDGGICPDGNTCCLQLNGTYGCCPNPNAVCCSNHQTCCPEGNSCDPDGTCSENVKCPDGKSECPSGNTCCETTVSGVWGCCPIVNAKCCEDGVHCCPFGYVCNTKDNTCTDGASGKKIPFLSKLPATRLFNDRRVVAEKDPNIICPGGKSECPSGDTCCPTDQPGKDGCCPVLHAVCCSDYVHCCPEGYKCDVGNSTCDKESTGEKMPLLTKWLATKLMHTYSEKLMTALAAPKVTSPNIICPDGKSQCPDGNTCCKLSSGIEGCCPVPNAKCCEDGVHCCPSGYTCDVKEGTCTNGLTGITTALLTKQPAVVQSPPVGAVICKDHQSECPTNQTCCLTSTGAYACCPLVDATCCSDMKHCCPHGYICEKDTGICTKGINKLVTRKLLPMTKPLQTMNCSDGSHCTDDQTCCLLKSDKYGCCPRKSAVCCTDKVHCCPEGYICKDEKGTCIKGSLSLRAHKITKIVNVMCPDHHSECPRGNTCCKDSNGHFSCCNFTNAACCSDGIHCCPNGYKCNMATHSCDQQWSRIPFLSKSPRIRIL